MAEYIDRDKALTAFCNFCGVCPEGKRDPAQCDDILGHVLKELEPADVRPVVFCRDCKHSHMTYGGECKYCDFLQEDGGDALYLPKDFFCAAGERNRHDNQKD